MRQVVIAVIGLCLVAGPTLRLRSEGAQQPGQLIAADR